MQINHIASDSATEVKKLEDWPDRGRLSNEQDGFSLRFQRRSNGKERHNWNRCTAVKQQPATSLVAAPPKTLSTNDNVRSSQLWPLPLSLSTMKEEEKQSASFSASPRVPCVSFARWGHGLSASTEKSRKGDEAPVELLLELDPGSAQSAATPCTDVVVPDVDTRVTSILSALA